MEHYENTDNFHPLKAAAHRKKKIHAQFKAWKPVQRRVICLLRGGRQIWRLFLDSNNDVRAPHETTHVVVIKLNKIGKQKQTGGQVLYTLKGF